MSVQPGRIPHVGVNASLPVLEALLHEYPGMAYRCLNDEFWSMQYVSAGVKALTGYAPEDLVENRFLSFFDVIHPDDRQRIQQEINHALSSQTGFALTYRIVTAEGALKSVVEHGNAIRDTHGQVVGVQGFVMDVTAAEQTQQALDEVTKRFRYIAKATNDAIWDWDLSTNALWWSNGIHTICGFEEMAPSIESWTNLIHPEDKDCVVTGIHEAIASTRSDWCAEYRLQHKDGCYANVLDRAFIIRDPNGAAIRMVGGISDLTERKQSKLHLERLNRTLRILSQCNERLVHVVDEQNLLADICLIIVETGGYQTASVSFLRNDSRQSFQHAAGYSGDLQYLQNLDISLGTDHGDGPIALAIRGQSRVICADIVTDPVVARWRKELLSRGYRSGIWLPLTYDGQTLGVLTIYLGTVASHNDEELQLLQSLADNIAFGIANIRSRKHQERIELAAVKIAAGVSASTGVAFFTQFARNMAHAAGADAAFVAPFRDDGMQSAQTVTAIVDDAIIPNFEYEIVGSPCERIVTSTSCIVLHDVPNCFPGSAAAAMGMQSYVGCRLDSAAGRPLGLLFVLFRNAVLQPDFVAQVIQIFAARAGAELERRLSDVRIREQASLLNKAKDAIVVHDATNRVTFWNKGAERLYGLTAEEVLGMPIDSILFDDKDRYQTVHASLVESNEWQGETIRQRGDGSELVVEISSTLMRDAFGNPNSVLSIISDITKRRAAEHEVAHLAFHDRVTGLPNRHSLMKRLEQLLVSGSGSSAEGALLWIDLDHLKTLNDTRGHDMGDLLLQKTGKRIAELINSGDVAARFGGDEFVVLIGDLRNHPASAIAMAERLLMRLSEPFNLDEHIHSGSASIGLTFFRCGQDASVEILKRADIAMYEAKAAGRNSFRLFDAQMQKRVDSRAELEYELRGALENNALSLAYQPQVAETGQVIGAEALLRWDHPIRGRISPSEFIPLAEASGLIVSFGEWVLEQACVQLKRWEGDPATQSLSIAVNVSAQQIRHHGFVDQVMDTLCRTGANPRKLKLELTESTLVTDAEATAAKMTMLKTTGIRFSLDDFGTGFSSLSYLNRLPLDQLKIDRSFVSDVTKDPNAAAIARTVITLAQSLGLEVIAEGVENQAQRRFLAMHGCRTYQGYLFSQPVGIEALEDYIYQSCKHHSQEAVGLEQ